MSDHVHYGCPSCRAVFCTDDPHHVNMVEGDSCPQCHIANVTRLAEAPPSGEESFTMPPELLAFIQPLMVKTTERDDRMLVLRERMLVLREQQVDALRSIANSLEILTQAMAVDDSGLAGLRIVGEVTGGDGDVREPA